MVDSSYDEMTTTEGNCNENLERNLLALRYPFAFVLRVRVGQIVCGICTLVMGAVAFIDEKTEINMGVGVMAGASMIIAAGLFVCLFKLLKTTLSKTIIIVQKFKSKVFFFKFQLRNFYTEQYFFF